MNRERRAMMTALFTLIGLLSVSCTIQDKKIPQPGGGGARFAADDADCADMGEGHFTNKYFLRYHLEGTHTGATDPGTICSEGKATAEAKWAGNKGYGEKLCAAHGKKLCQTGLKGSCSDQGMYNGYYYMGCALEGKGITNAIVEPTGNDYLKLCQKEFGPEARHSAFESYESTFPPSEQYPNGYRDYNPAWYDTVVDAGESTPDLASICGVGSANKHAVIQLNNFDLPGGYGWKKYLCCDTGKLLPPPPPPRPDDYRPPTRGRF